MTKLSLMQLPIVPVVVEGADMTKVSKSTLSWQMSEEEGQMVYVQLADAVAVL